MPSFYTIIIIDRFTFEVASGIHFLHNCLFASILEHIHPTFSSFHILILFFLHTRFLNLVDSSLHHIDSARRWHYFHIRTTLTLLMELFLLLSCFLLFHLFSSQLLSCFFEIVGPEVVYFIGKLVTAIFRSLFFEI